MKGQPTTFWGKCHKENDVVVSYHPLVDHCADVAACAEALLQYTAIGSRLAKVGGLSQLPPSTVARLCVLALLHDLGKFGHGFQNKGLPSPPWTSGHVLEALWFLEPHRGKEYRKFVEALDLGSVVAWAPDPETVIRLLRASICHHGRVYGQKTAFEERNWKRHRDLDPFAGMAQLMRLARSAFPEAFDPQGDPLPESPRFAHAFAGITMLADWLGSDRHRWFPFSEEGPSDDDPLRRARFSREQATRALRETHIDPRRARGLLAARVPVFADIVPQFAPRPAQAVFETLCAAPDGSVAVLEADTGSGKTEAALLHYARLFQRGEVDGLYFALPTRTAAIQIHGRVCDIVAQLFPDPRCRPGVTLAVPGYLRVDDWEGKRLGGFAIAWSRTAGTGGKATDEATTVAPTLPTPDNLWPDDDGERAAHRAWAAEHSKRYLAAPIAIGTIDQLLLSGLAVKHAHLRAAARLRLLLVVDEVHASDAYMTRILEQVLADHLRTGGHALLLSATLTAATRERLICPNVSPIPQPPPRDEARQIPYPLVTFAHANADREAIETLPCGSDERDKPVIAVELSPLMDGDEAIATRAFRAAEQGARVLVLRNTVRGCRRTQRALEAIAERQARTHLILQCADQPVCHHARFAPEDRALLDEAIVAALGKERSGASGCVAIATQTVQQSLDLDVDLMLTDLCPIDVLLQRAGRLHRHSRDDRPTGFEQPLLVVLTPADRDLGRYLGGDRVFGPHGIGTVYDDLCALEGTWRVLERDGELAVPQRSRHLVEDALHPEVLQAIADEGGEAWQTHGRGVLGRQLADETLAGLCVLDCSVPLEDTPEIGELNLRIQTRLGESDRIVTFARAPRTPFGACIQALTIPGWWCRGVDAETSATGLSAIDGGFRFDFGSEGYAYDRLGVRKEKDKEDDDVADA